jgi:hypothetical protein
MSASEVELRAVLSALRFHGADTGPLSDIADSRWPAILALTDRAQLTLALGVRASACLPRFVRERISSNLAGNALRHQRLPDEHRRIFGVLNREGLSFQVLKGITNWPWYCELPEHRPQSDIDILCAPEVCRRAAGVLGELGWKPVNATHTAGADHLPIMIRQTGWTWKGDHFDPEMPHALEIHFRLWDSANECVEVEGLDDFIQRSIVRDLEGLSVPALEPGDGLTYACLHLTRHLLRGSLLPRHVYEIAHFLEHSAADHQFWELWRTHSASAPRRKQLSAIAFRLAVEWFGCVPHPTVNEAIAELPRPVALWFDLFAWSPVTGLIRPNKDELWLHISLVDSVASRLRIAIGRILPLRSAGVVLEAHVPSTQIGFRLRCRRLAYSAGFSLRRLFHHARAALPLIGAGVRFWFARMRAL